MTTTTTTTTTDTLVCGWSVDVTADGESVPCGEPATVRGIGVILGHEVYAGWTIEHAGTRAEPFCPTHHEMHAGVYARPGHAHLTFAM